MVSHHVGSALVDAGGIVPIMAGYAGLLDELDKAVHLAAIHILNRGSSAVRVSAVPALGIIVGLNTRSAGRVRNANRRLSVARGDSIGSRKGAEVAVERPVLLHDDNHMPDVANGFLRLSMFLGLGGGSDAYHYDWVIAFRRMGMRFRDGAIKQLHLWPLTRRRDADLRGSLSRRTT